MLSRSQRLRVVAENPLLVEKFQRMEALSIRLSKLLGHSIFTLQKSRKYPEGMWALDVDWSNYGSGYIEGGHDEVTYVVLDKRVKGLVRRKWSKVMAYQRDFESGSRDEKRHLFEFDTSVVAVLDTLSDELEEQIAKASQATAKYEEQFRKVVEEHPRVEKNRFDDIEPVP